MQITGFFDGLRDGRVVGWACDREAPHRRLQILCYLDDRLIGRVTADLHRADVERAGIGDGRYGFALPLPFEREFQAVTINLVEADSGAPLSGCPKRLDLATEALRVVADRIRDDLGTFPILDAPYGPISARALAEMSAPEPQTAGMAGQFSKLLAHCWALERWKGHLKSESDRLSFLIHWLRQGPSCDARHVQIALDESALAHWTGTILGPPIISGPMSRLLFQYWLGAEVEAIGRRDTLADPRTIEGYAGLVDRFVTELLVDRRLPSAILGRELRDYLDQPAPGQRWETPVLTRLWMAIARGDSRYRSRFDVSLESDRAAFSALAIVSHASRGVELDLFPDHMMQYWRAPLAPWPEMPSRFSVLAGLLFRPELVTVDAAWNSERSRALENWSRGEFKDPFRSRPSPSIASHSNRSVENGVHIIGYTASDAGLSRNTRMSRNAFRMLRVPVSCAEIGGSLAPFEPIPGGGPIAALRRPVALCHLNADVIPHARLAMDRHFPEDTIWIGYLLWELTEPPAAHLLALDLLDEIWVPTEFVRDIYARQTNKPVIVMGKSIEEPEIDGSLTRSDFGLRDDAFLYLVTFDGGSSIERKNPLAAIDAFHRAYPSDPSVGLVIKTTNMDTNSFSLRTGAWEATLARIGGDSRIKVIERQLAPSAFMRLNQLCDCYVSLHRSEGFGYGPADAMMLGRPVIVTDFSGTRDYCNETNSWPVQYRLKPVQPGEFLYDSPGAFWADPDISSAAAALLEVRNHPETVAKRTQSGRHTVNSTFGASTLAARYLERLKQLAVLA